MKKSLFLEFKFGQVDLGLLKTVDFTDLIVSFDPDGHNGGWGASWTQLKKLQKSLSLSLVAFDQGGCPADPAALEKLYQRLDQACNLGPEVVWLDHFRFDGRWESIEGVVIPQIHSACRFCQNLNRAQFLFGLAEKIMNRVNRSSQVGYFAVPFKADEVWSLGGDLGQSHFLLRQIFDLVSPMLYHRLIKKPVSYISEFVRYLDHQSNKPILPMIQVKDMPDNLVDKLSSDEIRQEFAEAVEPPSLGVAFFSWDHAVEKGKTEVIRELFSSV